MIVPTASDRPRPYAGMGRFKINHRIGLGDATDSMDFQGEGDIGTSLSIDPELFPTSGGPSGVFSLDNSSGENPSFGTGVSQDVNGNWLDASGKLTNFNTPGSTPGSMNYNPGVLSNLFNALAITTPSIVAAVNGAPIANTTQCKAAGGTWTGTSCVKSTMNTSTLLMYGLGLGALLLLISKGRR